MSDYFMGGVQRGLSGVLPPSGLAGVPLGQRGVQSGGNNTTKAEMPQMQQMPQFSQGLSGMQPVQMPQFQGGAPIWTIPTEVLFPEIPSYSEPSIAHRAAPAPVPASDPYVYSPSWRDVPYHALPNPYGMPQSRLETLLRDGIVTPATEKILSGQWNDRFQSEEQMEAYAKQQEWLKDFERGGF